MAINNIVSSSDEGAPFLRGEAGALYTVMKWALPQLGWTIEYDDPANNKIVFRNNPLGTGDYLRFADNPGDSDLNERGCNVRSYADMSTIDDGVDGVGDSSWFIVKSQIADSAPRAWKIIGDSYSFWLLVAAGESSGDAFNEYYLGDIAPDRPGDPGAFLTQASNETNISQSAIVTPFSVWGNQVNGHSELRYDLDQSVVGVVAVYSDTVSSSSVSGRSSDPGAFGNYPEPATGGIRVIDVQVHEAWTNDIRGRLRGGMQILNDVVGVFPDEHIIEGQATARGLADCMILNRYARLSNPNGQGVLLFDVSTDLEAW